MIPNPTHPIFKHPIIENALIMPRIQQLAHNRLTELRMALHADQPTFGIHALHLTNWTMTQRLDLETSTLLLALYRCRISKHDIPMHLMQADNVLAAEKLLALRGHLHETHARLPAFGTSGYFAPESAADYLVPEADAYDPDAGLLVQQVGGVGDEFGDPEVVVEGVEAWAFLVDVVGYGT